MRLQLPRLSSALRVVLLYALFSVIWIVVSDELLRRIAHSDDALTLYQHYKGTFFVLISAGLLYLVLRGEHRYRERAQAAMRESERRFRLAIQEAPVPAMIHADDGRIVTVNRAWLDATGYTPADIPNMDEWTRRAYGEQREPVLQRLHRLYELQQQSEEGEYLVRVADGSLRTWHFSSAPLGPDPDGHRLVISMAVDVTDRRNTEDALRRAKELAEAASKAKDQFLAILSHELRTPLTPVLAVVSAANAVPPSPEDYRDQMEMIRRNIELEARLIDDLLDLTRVTRGKVQLDRRPLDLLSILAQVQRVCQPDIDARGVQLRVHHETMQLMMLGDSARLQQVFWNLLKNAVKFSSRGGVVELRSRREHEVAVVEIHDYGMGMDAGDVARLFTPFAQSAPAMAANGGGLGLGLTIARAMAELHGGTIAACSEGRGRGSTFTVTLPLARAEEQAQVAPPVSQADAGAQREEAASRPLRILLVEDHADTSRIMQRLLQRQGYQVMAAGNVDEALSLLRSGTFDLLLSDLGLPGRSGLDLIRELRQAGSRLAAVAISGFGRDEDVQASRDAGFDEHLTKPIDFVLLREVIARNAGPRHEAPVARG